MKKLLATGLVCASLGAIGAGVLSARDGHALEVIDEADTGDAATSDTEDSPRACDGASRRRHRAARALFGATAEAIGISRAELRSELVGGGSIADVAESRGVDPADVESALLADVERRVAESVERGKIEAERATRILEAAPERLHEFVTKPRASRPVDE
jgi:hypothetical protein